MVLIVAIIGIDEASERVERKVNNSYELLTVKDESHFNRILNYENKREDNLRRIKESQIGTGKSKRNRLQSYSLQPSGRMLRHMPKV